MTDATPAQARADFTAFKRYLWGRYQRAPHLDLLDKHLAAVQQYTTSGGRSGIGRLLVMMPPRHGKTLTISRMFPAWYLGHHPLHRVIIASYGQTLASKHSRYVRTLLKTARYAEIFPQMALAADSRSAAAWELELPPDAAPGEPRGGLDAMGVGGAVTGLGAHLLIWDDPVKNRVEAESAHQRTRLWDAWISDFFTRLEPGGAVIGVMTRWHQDDWMGHLLREQPDTWTVLRLPALAEADDPLGRDEGAALWPARFDDAHLHTIRERMHAYNFAALYQQRPIPASGGLFKREHFLLAERPSAPPVLTARYWDLAMSANQQADFTVGVKLARLEDGRIAVLDVARARLDWDAVPDFIANVALADGPDVLIGYEHAAYMSRAGQILAHDPRLHAHSVWGYPREGTKFTNALPIASRVGQRMVLVIDAPWTADYLDELCAFPNCDHDDQVDATAGAYAMLESGSFAGGLNLAGPGTSGGY